MIHNILAVQGLLISMLLDLNPRSLGKGSPDMVLDFWWAACELEHRYISNVWSLCSYTIPLNRRTSNPPLKSQFDLNFLHEISFKKIHCEQVEWLTCLSLDRVLTMSMLSLLLLHLYTHFLREALCNYAVCHRLDKQLTQVDLISLPMM